VGEPQGLCQGGEGTEGEVDKAVGAIGCELIAISYERGRRRGGPFVRLFTSEREEGARENAGRCLRRPGPAGRFQSLGTREAG
jgi:hypothetical protein